MVGSFLVEKSTASEAKVTKLPQTAAIAPNQRMGCIRPWCTEDCRSYPSLFSLVFMSVRKRGRHSSVLKRQDRSHHSLALHVVPDLLIFSLAPHKRQIEVLCLCMVLFIIISWLAGGGGLGITCVVHFLITSWKSKHPETIQWVI